MKNKTLKDKKIWNLIGKEKLRQDNELELIASENYASEEILKALSTPLTNKYSEGYPNKRYYGGNHVVDEIENLAIGRAKKLFKAEYANVQPLSGSPANLAVYMALLKPGDKILAMKLDHGGHLSHGHPVNSSGILYNFVHYGVNEKTGLIDIKEVEKIALKEKPKMIVAGFSAYSRNIDWKGFKKIADKINAYTFADISHIAGLIAGKQLENPVPIFDVVSTTTHKTLRGPRGAIILCKEKFKNQIDKAIFPGLQGGPHNNTTAAKAICFKEAMEKKFQKYAEQTIKNSQAMAEEFIKMDYKIISGGTDNHLFVIDLRNKNISGKEAELLLEKIGISISRSTIPGDPNPPFNPSGIRIGTPAITTRGLKEKDIKKIAFLINESIKNKNKEKVLNNIKKEIKTICQKFSI